MQVRTTNNLSDQERQQLFGWGEDIFGMTSLNLQWKPKDHHLFIEVDDCAVSHVGLLQYTVKVGDREVKVGGIGGVVTVPAMQGRGYARLALEHAHSLMCREWGVEFGLLFCHERLGPFYQRIGWQRVQERVEIDQPSGKIISPLVVMVLPCKDEVWPVGVVNINSFPW